MLTVAQVGVAVALAHGVLGDCAPTPLPSYGDVDINSALNPSSTCHEVVVTAESSSIWQINIGGHVVRSPFVGANTQSASVSYERTVCGPLFVSADVASWTDSLDFTLEIAVDGERVKAPDASLWVTALPQSQDWWFSPTKDWSLNWTSVDTAYAETLKPHCSAHIASSAACFQHRYRMLNSGTCSITQVTQVLLRLSKSYSGHQSLTQVLPPRHQRYPGCRLNKGRRQQQHVLLLCCCCRWLRVCCCRALHVPQKSPRSYR